MARTFLSSGNPLEADAGYSRAVVQGDWCFVAGTTGRYPATGVVPEDVVAQAEVALGIIEAALADGGFTFADVVRATYYVTDASYCAAIMPLLGAMFASVKPAATMVVVAALVAPELKVEIEITAYRGG